MLSLDALVRLVRRQSDLTERTETVGGARKVGGAWTGRVWVLTFPADVAAVGPVPGVQPLVGLQAVGVPQRPPTVAAEEASTRVGEHVAAQLRLLGEALLALGAGEGLVSAVDPQVGLQVPWGAEGPDPRLLDGLLSPLESD